MSAESAIRAFMQGRAIKERKEQQALDLEDRADRRKLMTLKLKQEELQDKAAQRQEAIQNAQLMQGQPGRNPIEAGQPGQLPATADAPVVPLEAQQVPHEPVRIPGAYGAEGVTVQPQTRQELKAQTMQEALAKMQLEKLKNTYQIDGQQLPTQAIGPTITSKGATERAKILASKPANLSDTEVYADQMAKAHEEATGQPATAAQRAKWMKDYRESSRAILQTGMSQFAGTQDGQAVIFKPTRGGGSMGTLPLPGQGPMQPKTEPADVRTQRMGFAKAEPVLGAISELSEKINVNQGVVAKLIGGAEKLKAQANLNDDVAEYESLVSGFTPLVARAVGHVGVLTEQDVQSVRKLFPAPGDSKSLRDRKINRLKSITGEIQKQVRSVGSGGPPTSQGGGGFSPDNPYAK